MRKRVETPRVIKTAPMAQGHNVTQRKAKPA